MRSSELKSKKNVGVVGYSAQKFDEDLARKHLSNIIKKLNSKYQLEIVSGLTNLGIPRIAYDVASKLGIKTVGIACEKANEFELYPVNEKIIVGTNWGDESKTFLNRIDILVRVGGGKQSRNETELAKKLGKTVYEFELNAINEAPITNWTVDPDMHSREKEMISKFHGYSQEKKHWSDVDKKLIKNPDVIKKITTSFLKVPYDFKLYFWQSTDPDYDPFLQKGLVSDADLKNIDPRLSKYIKQTSTPDSISVILTNNISDEGYVPIKNAWMLAHRIAHAIVGGDQGVESNYKITNLFNQFVKKSLIKHYKIEWPDAFVTARFDMGEEYIDTYGKILGNKLSTMQSARKNIINNYYEWQYELFAQYLLTGKITFNKFPVELDSDARLQSPEFEQTKDLYQFSQKLSKSFQNLLEEAKGKTWMI